MLAGGAVPAWAGIKPGCRFAAATWSSAVAGAVASAAGNVTLVGHSELPGIPDRYPGEGPLGGILTALHHTSADWNLIVACDMPEISADFLAELLARGHAVASRRRASLRAGRTSRNRSVPSITGAPCRSWKQHFARGVRKVTAALDGLAVERLAVAELSLFSKR